MSRAGVPGDPGELAAMAARLRTVADTLDQVARMTGGSHAKGWSGRAAQAFGLSIAAQSGRMATGSAALGAAAQALARYAAELADAQCQASLALSAAPPSAVAVPGSGPAMAITGAVDSARRRACAAAARATAELSALATAVPPRPAMGIAALESFRRWQAEIGLGAFEATGQLLGTALRLDPSRVTRDPVGWSKDVSEFGSGLVHGVTHPGEFLRAVTDADTWQHNPSRAIGHLVPDVVAAVTTGGAGTAGSAIQRSTTATSRASQTALRAKAFAERNRAAAKAEADAVRNSTAAGWRGEGGLGLEPRAAAAVRSYLATLAPHQGRLTAEVQSIAARAGGRLEGLEYRFKELDSVNRKVAEDLATAARPVRAVLAELDDVLRFTLVIPTWRYTARVRRAAALLDDANLALTGWTNHWRGARYRGINSVWTDPGTGVPFELQFHTPASRRATVSTHPMYRQFRLSQTPAERRIELQNAIAEQYRRARIPWGVDRLTFDRMPPPYVTLPRPAVPRIDLTEVSTSGLTVVSVHLGSVGAHNLATTRERVAHQGDSPLRTPPCGRGRWRPVAFGHCPG